MMKNEPVQIESLYKSLFETAPVAIVVHRNNHFLYANSLTLKLFGAESWKQLESHPVLDLIHKDDRAAVSERIQCVMKGEKIQLQPVRLARLDGKEIIIEPMSSLIEFNGSTAVQDFIRDATDRIHLETKIEYLARFPSENPNPVLRLDKDGIILYANQASKPVLQVWHSEIGKSIPEDWRKIITDTFSSGSQQSIDMQCNGFVFSFVIVPFPDSGYVNIYGKDITERKMAEEAIRNGDERLRFALEASRTGAWDLDLIDHTAFRTLGHDVIFGYDRLLPEWTYEMFIEHVLPEDREMVDSKFQNAIKNKGDWNFECRIRRKDGEIRWIRAIGRLKIDFSGNARRMAGIVQDVTERKQMENTIRENEARMREVRALLEAVTVGANVLVSTIDKEFRYTYFNEAHHNELKRLTGKETRLGMSLMDVLIEMPEQKSIALDVWRRALEGETVVNTMKFGDPGIYQKWYSTHHTPIRDSAGNIIGAGEITSDVTDFMHSQEALLESEKRLELALEASHQATWENNFITGEIVCSPRMFKIYGVTDKSKILTQDEWRSFVIEEDRHNMTKAVDDAINGDGTFWIQYRIKRRSDGDIRWIESYGQIQKNPDGKPVKNIGIIADITERKKSEEELRNSRNELERRVQSRTAELMKVNEELALEIVERKKTEVVLNAERRRFNEVLELLPAYLILLTPDYHVTFANRFFRDRFGESHGKRCYEYLFGRTEPCEICETYKVIDTGKPHHWEWKGPDSHIYSIFDFPFVDTDGTRLIMEMGIDITEEKRMGDGLKAAALYTRGLLEASLDPLVTINSEGKITDVNKATVDVIGVERDQIIGTDFSNYFTEPEKARIGYQEVFAKGFVTDYPLTIRHQNGKLTHVLYNAAVFRDIDGNISGVFAAARDVTEKKATELELEKYHLHLEELVKQRTEELEKANRQLQSEILHSEDITRELERSNKDLVQFAYVASHDLQEPLRAVSGFVSLLQTDLQDNLNEKRSEYMEFIIDGVKRMQSLINGLLDYSRIESKSKSFDWIDSNTALKRALADLHSSIKESDARITSDPLPNVCFDMTQLIQLFQNLISNAIKFRGNSPPEIHVSVARKPDSWQFAVADNGIGIDSQYSERIFMIFKRLHTREKYPGTGIGLAICKKIIERQGGKIWVEANKGKGTTFYFTIPNKGEVQQ